MNDQAHRLDNFTQLMARFQQAPTDYDEGEEEDPRPYVSGEKELSRFCCVTVHRGKYFFLPTFDEAFDACNRATEFAYDDIFEEIPVAVVDLDEGREMIPLFRRILWSEWR